MDSVYPAVPAHQLQARPAATVAHAALAELLVLPAAALDLRIQRELAGNPALDAPPPARCPRCGADLDGLHQAYGCARPTSHPSHPGVNADSADHPTHPGPAAPGDPGADLLSEVASADRWIAAGILADLDERGLLGRDPVGAARWLGVTPQRVRRVLALLRAASRPDLAAADLCDALLLQLAALDLPADATGLLRRLVAGHLAEIAADRIDTVATHLDLPVGQIRAAVAQLRALLRPPTGVDRAEPVGPPVVPDIVLRWAADGTAEVSLPRHGPRLVVDPGYARLAATATGRTADELARVRAELTRAREFLDRLARRDGALRRIAEAAVAHQVDFLRGGALAHTSLTRTALARQVGVHPSTVSRAASGKTVLLPDRRLVGFDTFFGTATGVRERLAELVAAESGACSDGQLAAALRGYGHRVARRTVAKYRAQLGIPAADAR